MRIFSNKGWADNSPVLGTRCVGTNCQVVRRSRRTVSILPLIMVTLMAPWGGQAEIRQEFIFESAPFASCHASTLVETKGGGIIAAWFGGSAEGNPDVAIWISRNGQNTWSSPRMVVNEPGVATYNPVLFRTSNDLLWLFYKFGPNPTSWTGAYLTSSDDGQTWSKPVHMPAGLYGPIKNKPLILADGTIVAGSSVESYHSWACWVERSTDNARTWTRRGPITVPGIQYGIIQPTIVPISGHRLRMFVRATEQIGRVCYADSSDEGLSWTFARPTSLPNPNSGIDAVKLQDGRLLLVYNHSESSRSPLNVAVSEDDGNRWRKSIILENGPGEYSYPAVIQGSDGTIHITYTYRRKRIKHVAFPPSDVDTPKLR